MAKRVKKDKINNEYRENGEINIISKSLKLKLITMKVAINIVNYSSEKVLSKIIFNIKNILN